MLRPSRVVTCPSPLPAARSCRGRGAHDRVDIGGTKVLAGVVDPLGNVLEKRLLPTPGHDVQLVEDTIVRLVQELRRDFDVAAVGIGAAGFVDASRTIVMFSPHLNWRREPLRSALGERLRLPVVVDNDANTAAIAELASVPRKGTASSSASRSGPESAAHWSWTARCPRFERDRRRVGHMQMVPNGHRCECGNRGCWEQYAPRGTLFVGGAGADHERLAGGTPPSRPGGRGSGAPRRSPDHSRRLATATRCRSSWSETSESGWGSDWPVWPRRSIRRASSSGAACRMLAGCSWIRPVRPSPSP